MNYNLKVINFCEDDIVLEDEEKNIIYWPKSKVPQIPELGEVLSFKIGAPLEDKKTDPHDLLNELLKIPKI